MISTASMRRQRLSVLSVAAIVLTLPAVIPIAWSSFATWPSYNEWVPHVGR